MAYINSGAADQFDSSPTALRIAFLAAAVTLILLGALHVVSPEFDASWRMVSEYANGKHGVLLSLMFASWALSSWALTYAIWPLALDRTGKIGLAFLLAAGLGEAMASVFDIKHPLHGPAAMIGIPSLPIAAMLISLSIARVDAWRPARKILLWTASLTWVGLVLMAAAFAVFIYTFKQAGGDLSASREMVLLPEGVIALVGWSNRLLIIVYCVWVMAVALRAIKTSDASP